jgi:phosphate uptake regulator
LVVYIDKISNKTRDMTKVECVTSLEKMSNKTREMTNDVLLQSTK